MSELMQMVAGRPRPQLSRLVAGYTGYRIEGAEPALHLGLPSRHLTFIVTLSGTVDLATMPDPAQPPASFVTLVGGLHATPAVIRHNGHQHGIQLSLTPLGAVDHLPWPGRGRHTGQGSRGGAEGTWVSASGANSALPRRWQVG